MYDRKLELKRLANKIVDIDIYESVFDRYDKEKWDDVIKYLYEEDYKKPNSHHIISINVIKLADKINHK